MKKAFKDYLESIKITQNKIVDIEMEMAELAGEINEEYERQVAKDLQASEINDDLSDPVESEDDETDSDDSIEDAEPLALSDDDDDDDNHLSVARRMLNFILISKKNLRLYYFNFFLKKTLISHVVHTTASLPSKMD